MHAIAAGKAEMRPHKFIVKLAHAKQIVCSTGIIASVAPG